MVKFKDVYDPQEGKSINCEKAIDEIRKGKRDEHYYWCPVCKDERSKLMFVTLNNGTSYFKIMPKCYHINSNCPYLEVRTVKSQGKTFRNYLGNPDNKQACLRELERKLNGVTSSSNVALSPNLSGNSGGVSLQKNNSQKNQKMRRVNRPHLYQINARNIFKIRAMTQQGGFDYENFLPIGLYGKAFIEYSNENEAYKNYKVWDECKITYFALGVKKRQAKLIHTIDQKLNKVIEWGGIFCFYSREKHGTVYTNARVEEENDIFFKSANK